MKKNLAIIIEHEFCNATYQASVLLLYQVHSKGNILRTYIMLL